MRRRPASGAGGRKGRLGPAPHPGGERGPAPRRGPERRLPAVSPAIGGGPAGPCGRAPSAPSAPGVPGVGSAHVQSPPAAGDGDFLFVGRPRRGPGPYGDATRTPAATPRPCRGGRDPERASAQGSVLRRAQAPRFAGPLRGPGCSLDVSPLGDTALQRGGLGASPLLSLLLAAVPPGRFPPGLSVLGGEMGGSSAHLRVERVKRTDACVRSARRPPAPGSSAGQGARVALRNARRPQCGGTLLTKVN